MYFSGESVKGSIDNVPPEAWALSLGDSLKRNTWEHLLTGKRTDLNSFNQSDKM